MESSEERTRVYDQKVKDLPVEDQEVKGVKMDKSQIAVAVAVIVIALVGWQISSLKDGQEQLRLENARLSGIAEAQGDRLDGHETQIKATAQQLEQTDAKVLAVEATAQVQGEQIAETQAQVDQQAKDLKSVQRQVKVLKETPVSTVVVAATDEAAKQQAFDGWAKQHPDWKARRSCMKAKMNENNSISLTEAYNGCG